MYLHRFIVGIKCDKRSFKLPSVGGALIDEIFSYIDDEKILGHNYFTKVMTAQNTGDIAAYNICLTNENESSSLQLFSDQVIFKRTSNSDKASISLNNSLDEFKKLWSKVNGKMQYIATRRIGLVGEYRIEPNPKSHPGIQLVDSLTKLPIPEQCNQFRLRFDSKDSGVDDLKDDYWNEIFTFYTSNRDKTPEGSWINASIDVQKYYNPLIKMSLKELMNVKEKYLESKNSFKKNLVELGLDNNEK